MNISIFFDYNISFGIASYVLVCPVKIWGAGLCGWVGPVSPLEVILVRSFFCLIGNDCFLSFEDSLRFFLQFQLSRTVSLLLHINGTYRVHWADRLGFCKNYLGYLRADLKASSFLPLI